MGIINAFIVCCCICIIANVNCQTLAVTTAATTKPAGATTAPVGATTKPAGATTAPVGATTKPAGATTKPAGATTAPVGATTKPAGVTTASGGATGPTTTPPQGGSGSTSEMEPWKLLAIIIPIVVGGITLLSIIIFCCCCRGGRMGAQSTSRVPASYSDGPIWAQQATNYRCAPPRAVGGSASYAEEQYVSNLAVNGGNKYGIYGGGSAKPACTTCQGPYNQPRSPYGGIYGGGMKTGCGCGR